MSDCPTGRLFFEMKMFDDYGRVHGVVRRELDENAAFQGQRIAEDMRLGVVGMGSASPFDTAVEVLRVKEFRRSLLKEAGAWAGVQLADFLEDREGWHGIERQERVEKIATDNRN